MTLAGSILTTLRDNWSLTGLAARDNIHFSEKEWYDADVQMKPQVTVTPYSDIPYQGILDSGHSYARFAVNVWVPLATGNVGSDEVQQAEDMRYEVPRIIRLKKRDIAEFKPILPQDNGIPRHNIPTGNMPSKPPYCLRYEIMLIGAHDIS